MINIQIYNIYTLYVLCKDIKIKYLIKRYLKTKFIKRDLFGKFNYFSLVQLIRK